MRFQRPSIRQLFSWLFLAVAAVCFAAVASIIIAGGRWERTIVGHSFSAGDPNGRLWYGACALLVCYLVRAWPGKNWREWAKLAGRVSLLAASLYASVFVGEVLLRRVLRNNQSAGTIQDLAHAKSDSDIRVVATHPLASITRVSSRKQLVYELKSDVTMLFGHKRLKTNSGGMRDDNEYSMDKPANVTRIIGIGDSGMFGWGCHQEESYLSVIEENLANHYGGGRYQVLNMAVPGYNTFQEVETLRHKGLAYHPDIVVVGWCPNDASAPFFLQKQRTYDEKDISYLYHLLFNRTLFRDLTRPLVMNAGDVDEAFVDPEILARVGLDGVAASFSDLKRMGDERGFRVLVFGPLGAGIVAICKKTGLDFFDTYSIPRDQLPEEDIYFMHPRPKAHRFLAERLELHMLERGWLPKAEAH